MLKNKCKVECLDSFYEVVEISTKRRGNICWSHQKGSGIEITNKEAIFNCNTSLWVISELEDCLRRSLLSVEFSRRK